MTITDTYIDLGGTVHFFDQIDRMPHTKENACLQFIGMTVHSWTFGRMTEPERDTVIRLLCDANAEGRIKGTFDQRWNVMHLIYSAYLSGIGYTDFGWRKDEEEENEKCSF